MKITGSYTIDAPREQVWSALNDMDILARVVPGCQRLEQIGEHEFEGTIRIGIQSIKGAYNGRIRLEDIQPPRHYRLVVNGKSANGIVDGIGTVDLEEQDGKTILNYGGDAKIAGTLASVGQRLIEGAAKQLINQSLKALVEQIKQRASTPAEEPAPEPVLEQAEPAPTLTAAPVTVALDQIAAANGVAAPADAQPPEPALTPQTSASAAEELTTSITPPAPSAPPTPPVPPALAQPPEPPQKPEAGFERRAVVVPEHEQLKPEAVALGVIQDLVKERPWVPWVVVAFLLGYILGRSRN